VPDGQRIVGDEASGEDLLISLTGLLGLGEVVGKIGPDQFLARDSGHLDRGLVDVGDFAVRADRHQRVEARLDQAARVLRGLLAVVCDALDRTCRTRLNFSRMLHTPFLPSPKYSGNRTFERRADWTPLAVRQPVLDVIESRKNQSAGTLLSFTSKQRAV
jgi:hypothetical protein